jgi:hypothetical protein
MLSPHYRNVRREPASRHSPQSVMCLGARIRPLRSISEYLTRVLVKIFEVRAAADSRCKMERPRIKLMATVSGQLKSTMKQPWAFYAVLPPRPFNAMVLAPQVLVKVIQVGKWLRMAKA